eukprot:Gregarina_sp_Poly_1__7932@NODE_452_length_8287_cov_521_171290_g369_i0_p6_GENE_NODE_452_length_8287_cov_521_171290_g369_i0NODE_452_length_8287_cov_521_171290_g369_i0_p6_ORF_typecomplete_len190_score25_77_NODE_452_length_8287_cov_521_171290_g369_i059796548
MITTRSFQNVTDSIMSNESLRCRLASIYMRLKPAAGKNQTQSVPEILALLIGKIAGVFAAPVDLATLKMTLELFYIMHDVCESSPLYPELTSTRSGGGDRTVQGLVQCGMKLIQQTLKGQGPSLQELTGSVLNPVPLSEVINSRPTPLFKEHETNIVIGDMNAWLYDCNEFYAHPICLLSEAVTAAKLY